MRPAVVAGVRVPAALIEAALAARATNPGVLEALRVAVQATADEAARDLVSAAPDSIPLAQGRAQVWRALGELLAHPEKAKNQLDQMRKPDVGYHDR